LLSLFSCAAKSPSITLNPSSWEVGNIIQGSKVKKEIWVKNDGDGLLVVNFRSGCDCIEILTAPDSISPGDSALIIARYSAPDTAKQDQKEHSFHIQ
jgi:hypothetical protein